MAKDSLSSIIGLGAAGLAAYWLYNNWASLTSPAPVVAGPLNPTSASKETTNPAPTSTTPPPAPTQPVVPDWMANLDALRQKLESMAGGPSVDIDQWVYQYNQLRQQRNMGTLTGPQIAAILAVNPATVANRSTPIPSSEFVNDIFGLGYGLQGLRGLRGIGARRGFWPIMQVPYATRRRIA